MQAKLPLTVLGMLVATPCYAQVPVFSEGSQVIASPLMLPDRWEKCIVVSYRPASQGYELSCETSKYIVPSRFVLEANEQNEALLIPPAARDLMPAGTEVVASPTYLPDRWERCSVVKPLHKINGYEVRCGSVVYVVSRTQVLPANEDNIRLKLAEVAQNSIVQSEQAQVQPPNSPEELSDAQGTAVSTSNGGMAVGAANYYPGMMIEASPAEGIWGDAVVIERIEDGFRVQMMPGSGYAGTPQLILRPDQMRVPGAPTDGLTAARQLTEPEVLPEDLPTTQLLPDPGASTDGLPRGQRLPNGTYYCGKSTGGMVFFMGDIELRDGFYRGPAFDGQFGDWYPMDTTPEGTINWRGPLGGFESDYSRVVSTAIKSDGGNPAFDVILQLKSGNFMGVSCVPK